MFLQLRVALLKLVSAAFAIGIYSMVNFSMNSSNWNGRVFGLCQPSRTNRLTAPNDFAYNAMRNVNPSPQTYVL